MSKSDFFFLAFLASIPIQLNKFFFPSYSFVLGLPIDYRAVTVYLSDLAAIAYLLAFFIENFKNLGKIYLKHKQFILVLILFNIYLIISNSFFSISKLASLATCLKVLEFSLLSICASISFEKKNVFKFKKYVFAFSLIWQSALILAQFILQKSQGLWFLGERSFDASTVSIAHIQILGRQLLRPYGTFPHPNLAAAFLVITLIILWSNSIRVAKIKVHTLATFLSVAAIFLTYSKTALLAISLFGISLLKSSKAKLAAIALLVFLSFVSPKLLTEPQLASIAERLVLSQAALDITLKNPLFGVGSNNFILELSKLNLFSLAEIRLLQPVHNIFLLILAENGVFGLLLFTILLLIVFQKAVTHGKTILFLIILIFASLDHFLWTLQQGQLLFWLAIAFMVSRR